MIHIPMALLIQLVLWFVPAPWNIAIATSLIFVMREITQAEYRWMDANKKVRAQMPWWQGMDVSLWNQHSITDVLYPTAAVMAAAWWADVITSNISRYI